MQPFLLFGLIGDHNRKLFFTYRNWIRQWIVPCWSVGPEHCLVVILEQSARLLARRGPNLWINKHVRIHLSVIKSIIITLFLMVSSYSCCPILRLNWLRPLGFRIVLRSLFSRSWIGHWYRRIHFLHMDWTPHFDLEQSCAWDWVAVVGLALGW